eukprot:scaffold10947_cov123-Isochrysis_galbana.AAC.3
MTMWFLFPAPRALCARFRDGELNPSPAKEEGLSVGAHICSYNHTSKLSWPTSVPDQISEQCFGAAARGVLRAHRELDGNRVRNARRTVQLDGAGPARPSEQGCKHGPSRCPPSPTSTPSTADQSAGTWIWWPGAPTGTVLATARAGWKALTVATSQRPPGRGALPSAG